MQGGLGRRGQRPGARQHPRGRGRRRFAKHGDMFPRRVPGSDGFPHGVRSTSPMRSKRPATASATRRAASFRRARSTGSERVRPSARPRSARTAKSRRSRGPAWSSKDAVYCLHKCMERGASQESRQAGRPHRPARRLRRRSVRRRRLRGPRTPGDDPRLVERDWLGLDVTVPGEPSKPRSETTKPGTPKLEPPKPEPPKPEPTTTPRSRKPGRRPRPSLTPGRWRRRPPKRSRRRRRPRPTCRSRSPSRRRCPELQARLGEPLKLRVKVVVDEEVFDRRSDWIDYAERHVRWASQVLLRQLGVELELRGVVAWPTAWSSGQVAFADLERVGSDGADLVLGSRRPQHPHAGTGRRDHRQAPRDRRDRVQGSDRRRPRRTSAACCARSPKRDGRRPCRRRRQPDRVVLGRGAADHPRAQAPALRRPKSSRTPHPAGRRGRPEGEN